jgi:polyphosphate kinase 2 (PPK2 family)
MMFADMTKMQRLQAEINGALQNADYPIAIVLEGRDGAGKTGAIRQATEYLPFRQYKIIHSRKPSSSAMAQWLQYWKWQLPTEKGQIFFFDRSWYSRALCQPLNGWASDRQVDNFLRNVEDWEINQQLDGLRIIKFWLSISEETQKVRLTTRIGCPLRGWKFSKNDANALKTYSEMSDLKSDVMASSNNWIELDFNDKTAGQIQMLREIQKFIGKENANIS